MGTKLFSSGLLPFSIAFSRSRFRNCWQLFLATSSIAFPASLSRFLKVDEFIAGTLRVESKLFKWVLPTPVCKQPRAALVFTSKVNGPRAPDLCSFDVLMVFSALHWLHRTVNVLAKPLCCSSITLPRDKGPKNIVKYTVN